MTATPFITVVLPTYQRAHVVGNAIRSVLVQTFGDFELLVVDDGSSDGTAACVSEFQDERVRLISVEHGGRSLARNEGIARARGEVLTFLDSDDLAEPDWLDQMRRPFSDPSVAAVCCGAHMTVDRPQIGRRQREIVLPRRVAEPHRVKPFLAGTYAIRPGVLDAIGPYDTRLAYGEHSELAARLAAHCHAQAMAVVTLDRPLVRIHNHRAFGGAVEFRERLEAAELVLERHGDACLEQRASSYANQRAVAGANAYRLGLTKRAIGHFVRALAADPGRPVHWARLALALLPPVARRFWTRQTRTGHA